MERGVTEQPEGGSGVCALRMTWRRAEHPVVETAAWRILMAFKVAVPGEMKEYEARSATIGRRCRSMTSRRNHTLTSAGRFGKRKQV